MREEGGAHPECQQGGRVGQEAPMMPSPPPPPPPALAVAVAVAVVDIDPGRRRRRRRRHRFRRDYDAFAVSDVHAMRHGATASHPAP